MRLVGRAAQIGDRRGGHEQIHEVLSLGTSAGGANVCTCWNIMGDTSDNSNGAALPEHFVPYSAGWSAGIGHDRGEAGAFLAGNTPLAATERNGVNPESPLPLPADVPPHVHAPVADLAYIVVESQRWQFPDGRFALRAGQRPPPPYHVKLDGPWGGGAERLVKGCDCRDFKYRGGDPVNRCCKHMAAVLKVVKGVRLCDRTQGGRCLLYTSPSPRDLSTTRMPSSA